MAHTAPEGPGPQIPSRLTLRAGVWYAGEQRCANYRDALKKTFAAAEIEIPKPSRKPSPKPRHGAKKSMRLELRPWWPVFLVDRQAREQARKAAA